jgi:predicted transcriptional regulator
VPIWLDFNQTMSTHFGLTTAQANVAVFDVEGRFRKVVNGTLDTKAHQELVDFIQQLRVEAVK